MTHEQWTAFREFRDDFRERCERWSAESAPDDWLATLQVAAAEADANPKYPLETPIVYSRALDDVREGDEIRLLVIGDNPGKDEQLAKNRRYLVGQAGKLGEGFFRRNLELGVDFRKNAIILNKTPIHTAKTKQLAWIRRNGGERFERLFAQTQRWMAERTVALARSLGSAIWLVGYGELRQTGLFAEYAKSLYSTTTSQGSVEQRGAMAREAAAPFAPEGDAPRAASGGGSRSAPEDTSFFPQILLFQHFSMNRFSIDLKERYNPAEDLGTNLRRIGLEHRREILGW